MLFLITLAWLVPVVLFFAWLTIMVFMNTKKVIWKFINASLTGTFFFAILFGDSVAGRIYLDYFCETEGGAHIYQTVKLGSEYWDKDGNAKFLYPRGIREKGVSIQRC